MARFIAINQAQRLLLTDEDEFVPVVDLHDDEGNKVDRWEDCVFVTCQMANGSWTYAHLSDFEPAAPN